MTKRTPGEPGKPTDKPKLRREVIKDLEPEDADAVRGGVAGPTYFSDCCWTANTYYNSRCVGC
jgi:hypothetical protein